jgi:hypothetical protein
MHTGRMLQYSAIARSARSFVMRLRRRRSIADVLQTEASFLYHTTISIHTAHGW